MEAHFGLGGHKQVDLKVVLPSGKAVVYPAVAADRYLDLDVTKALITNTIAERTAR